MIQAIAVDDERNALGIIVEFSKRIPQLKLLETFTDPTKALQYTGSGNRIDLIFLDIQMSRLNGITLAEHLPAETRIIITTAYPDYALQGYEMDVIDYLLKPFSFPRFQRAVHKVSLLKTPSQEEEKHPVAKLKPTVDDFIFVRTDYKTVKVKIADIQYIEGSGNYVTLHTKGAKFLVLQNMKNFEEQLRPYQFMRVHRSFIISFTQIDSIDKGWITIDKKEIPIGDSYRESFQDFLLKNYKQF